MSESETLSAGLEWVSRFEIELGPIVSLGQTPWGHRRVIAITGGGARGAAGPGGTAGRGAGRAGWQVVHDEGMISVDARYTLQTHDGAWIYATSRGVRFGSPEVLERLG